MLETLRKLEHLGKKSVSPEKANQTKARVIMRSAFGTAPVES